MARGDCLLRALPLLTLARALDAVLVPRVRGLLGLLGTEGELLDAVAVRRACGDEVPVIFPDGITAAAELEDTFHSRTPRGRPISAWERRGKTLVKTIERVNTHDLKLAKLEERLAAVEARPPGNPFP